MMKAVILDDEVKGSSLLQHKLKPFSSLISVEKVYNDPQKALREIASVKPDVLFLDVEMPILNGFQFLEKLGYFDFEVIFVTAYNMYTLDALRADALDYLLKPVDPEELECAVNKLYKRIEAKRNRHTVEPLRAPNTSDRLALPTGEGIYFVKKEDIIKVEAMSNYSVFKLKNAMKIIVSKTLKEFETVLEAGNFLRVNRSVIVNLDYIVRYKKGEGGTLELVDGSEIEVSALKKNLLLERLLGD
ncbi:LytR/AlgR family response regulator transcription factor [Sphingobacterium wenxiniae]|uniref:Two component transcriptional regulator, LytTR family n=1 Tax=Sphingobacterium wenxiniae TaxID=683125 RepID=A0A1I6VIQ9_9SPHI|nr:LytTR family DNA-binding domain-containing protein [Sphingobacterium wenxiniae]SFT13613.1 two component transcriptional regulator, LytTR family [Sphingobacterium wenxiniae]